MVFNGKNKIKTIVFRVDSAGIIGSGHLMRCLTLAKRLRDKADITFICRDLNGHMGEFAEQQGFRVIYLPRYDYQGDLVGYEHWLTVPQAVDAAETMAVLVGVNVDCLIVDHYALDRTWEEKLRPCVKKIMVIDDLGNRDHDCDILLDQNHRAEFSDKYTSRVPSKCRLFLGLRYLLLRDEFYEAKQSLVNYTGDVRRVLVFFGGSDPTNETMKTLTAIQLLNRQDIVFDVIVGINNRYRQEIAGICRNDDRMRFYCQIDYIAELMAKADAAIGAAGAAIWERCFLGLPSLVISVADNQGRTRQRGNDDMMMPYVFLGWHEDVSTLVLAEAMANFFADEARLRSINRNALALFGDAEGVSGVIEEIMKDD